MEAWILVRGKKAAAFWRSSISPQSVWGLASTSTRSSVRSWVRMVWAMAMPTLPAPMTEIFVLCFVEEGGAALKAGFKKAWVRSRPPGPNDDPDSLLCIFFGRVFFQTRW